MFTGYDFSFIKSKTYKHTDAPTQAHPKTLINSNLHILFIREVCL